MYYAPAYREVPKVRMRASNAWAVGGFTFGLLVVAMALLTDNGDGRIKKALGGWLLFLWLLSMFAIYLAITGSVI